MQGISDAGHALKLVINEFLALRRKQFPLVIIILTEGNYRFDIFYEEKDAVFLFFISSSMVDGILIIFS